MYENILYRPIHRNLFSISLNYITVFIQFWGRMHKTYETLTPIYSQSGAGIENISL